MSALRLTALAALSLALAVSVATSAEAKAPPVVQHTYLVQYQLAGQYSANTTYPDDSAGFCPGTGYVEDADVMMNAAATLKVKLESGTQTVANTLPSPNVGTWTAHGTAVSAGDPCSATKTESCSGALSIAGNQTGSSTLAAIGRKKQIIFGTDFAAVPHEVSVASDCDQTSDIYPVVSFNLGDALAPYEQATYAVPLVKLATLAKGKKLTGRAKPVRYPSGYNVATCDGSAPCIGSFSKLTSTITITRKK